MLAQLEILVPTFGRKPVLIAGLHRLSEQIAALEQPDSVSISVSDNASMDGTWEALRVFADSHPELNVRLWRQPRNIGLEANAVALLQRATAEWVMYLGDDDLLPEGYLDRVLDLMMDDETTCVVPGFSSLYPDGNVVPSRGGAVSSPALMYPPSWQSCAVLGTFGHQLSGTSFRREGTLDAYLARPELRNLYPFVFFVGFNALRGRGWYLPRFQVLVLQEQEKDWSYDSSHLLRDVLSNFAALFPNSPWKRSVCEVYFIWSQSWRLGISRRHFARASRGFFELGSSPTVSPQVRVGLPFLYAAVAARLAMGKVKRRAADRRHADCA